MLNVKLESCEYQLLKYHGPTGPGIESKTTDYETVALTQDYAPAVIDFWYDSTKNQTRVNPIKSSNWWLEKQIIIAINKSLIIFSLFNSHYTVYYSFIQLLLFNKICWREYSQWWVVGRWFWFH